MRMKSGLIWLRAKAVCRAFSSQRVGAAESGHIVFRQLHARLFQFDAGGDLLGLGGPLPGRPQDLIGPGLQADVDPGEPGLPQSLEGLQGQPGRSAGAGITGKPLHPGKAPVEMVQDGQQILGFDDEDVGILQKDVLGPMPEPMPGCGQGCGVEFLPGQIRLHLGKGWTA